MTDPYGQPPQDPYAPQPPAPPVNPYAPPAGPPAPPTSAQPAQQPYGAPQYGQPQYGQGTPGYGYAAATPPQNTMALVSLILSLVGLLTWISAPVGAILGHVAMKQIKQTGESGEGMAKAGVIVGWIITGLGLLACCGWIVLVIIASNA